MFYVGFAIVVLAILIGLEALARWLHLYASTEESWPAGWRAVVVRTSRRFPYRKAGARTWVLAAKAGMPPSVSLFLPAVFFATLLWLCAVVLAMFDLGKVALGHRALGFTLASLGLAVCRAGAGSSTVLGVMGRSSRLVFVGGGLALGLDMLLACVALPCSDSRTADVRVACIGGALQALILLGYAGALWQRHGLATEPVSQAGE